MTTTAEKIEIMQAYENGKAIEYKGKNSEMWIPNECPTWGWDMCDYRIKPEPEIEQGNLLDMVQVHLSHWTSEERDVLNAIIKRLPEETK